MSGSRIEFFVSLPKIIAHNISCVKQRNIFFSFIYRDGHWELSPAYDLTYNETLGEHATSVNFKGLPSDHATSVNFKGLPSDEDMITIGMNTKMSRERCLEIIREVKDALQTLNHNP